jgi:diaminopimelate decarboxylase
MTQMVQALLAQFFSSSTRELNISGAGVEALAARYGTPFFVYDLSIVERKLATLKRTLPDTWSIFYSVKANPNLDILRYFIKHCDGLEIASGGEFKLTMKAGCYPQRTIFAGPSKREDELEFVVKHGIGEIHVESLLEMDRLSAISRRMGVQTKIAIRVNPTEEAQGGAMIMGGKPSPFGIDEENLDEVVARVTDYPALSFRGVHLFTGTQILDYTVLVRQYRKALEIARRIVSQTGRPLDTVDFGGGLGVPYFIGEMELDMNGLRRELQELDREINTDPLLKGTHFIVEPGRYLVAEAGVYVARVNDVKTSRGKKFVVLDGGMNHHLAASGNLGQVIKRNFPLAVVSKLGEVSSETVDVVGPLCTPLDVLGREVKLPRVEVGDLIGIFQSGAYARSASPLGFLSHPAPFEIIVNDGAAVTSVVQKDSQPVLQ